jgi:hypothetical protein
VNKQEAGVEQETSDRRGSRRRHYFRGGGSFLFQLPTNNSPGDCLFRTHWVWFTTLRDLRAGYQAFGCKRFMHFGFYLMIAALVLIGLEAIYSLYQLAAFVL